MLTVAPAIDSHALEQLFRHKILKLLLSEGRITKSKGGRLQKSYDALEWLAAMCSHVPNKGEQMVRYYGYYSIVPRDRRQKAGDDAAVAYILKLTMPDKAFCKN
jgi:hypothetical protein